MNIKRFRIGILILALTTVTFLTVSNAVVQAVEFPYSTVSNVLGKISGNWYDDNGNLVISIKGNYINDCQVISGHDFAGGNPGEGHFRIQESQGIRDILILWDTVDNPPYIEIDKSRVQLHR
ncbi:hypothetical protein [Pectinatus haikarae]|uniref:Uncharacterized protein n=1 Tax=Pectinatus haikarae TaxID=349096 RepID=A0ABT9Y543_9FIRM|nr:hypothetical protein [Pectinatus haikarae]MDQ0202854.1 hypothetical protein [Pectinatus haikarae]